MKKHIKYVIASLLLVGTLTSCDDDYLVETDPNFVSADIFWTNLDESESNLTSVYGAMLNDYLLTLDRESLRTDIAFPSNRGNMSRDGAPFYLQTYTANLKHYGENWDAMYRVIWRANQVIQGLNSMGEEFKSQDRWTVQMAEARFFRGMMHMWLQGNYNDGKVVIRNKIPVGVEEINKAPSEKSDVIAFLREDLQYAHDNLPNVQDQKTRVSKGTAAFVLAKSYVQENEYTEAIPFLEDVITGPYGYQLLEGDDVKLLYTRAGEFNSENIFEINYTDKHQSEENTWDAEAFFTRWARFTAPVAAGGAGSLQFSPSAWLTYQYSNELKDPTDSRNLAAGSLISVPLRCAQMIAVVNDEESTYYGSKPGSETVEFTGTRFSNFKKLTNHDIITHEDQDLLISWKSSKNITLYRLADAYLMLAECKLETGQTQEAVDNINIIRARWGLQQLAGSFSVAGDADSVIFTDNTSGNAEGDNYVGWLRDHLRHVEKPLETSLEGYAERAIDLRRWGVFQERLDYLAGLEFNLENYTNSLGTVRGSSLLAEGAGVGNRNVQEYVEPAQNFHGKEYLALPPSETLYNSNLD